MFATSWMRLGAGALAAGSLALASCEGGGRASVKIECPGFTVEAEWEYGPPEDSLPPGSEPDTDAPPAEIEDIPIDIYVDPSGGRWAEKDGVFYPVASGPTSACEPQDAAPLVEWDWSYDSSPDYGEFEFQLPVGHEGITLSAFDLTVYADGTAEDRLVHVGGSLNELLRFACYMGVEELTDSEYSGYTIQLRNRHSVAVLYDSSGMADFMLLVNPDL